MQNTNTINGLFHIPDEGSLLKKLILTHPPVFNPMINHAYDLLAQHHKTVRMVQNEHYISMILPTISEGLTLEAMLITTEDENRQYFSIYHRLHFEDGYLIEADAFLRMSAVMTNIPINGKAEDIAGILNYQIQEAFNIEITMLSLADSNLDIAKTNILPFVMNAISRLMLACVLDGIAYKQPTSSDDLGRVISQYCDIPLSAALEGISALEDWKSDMIKSEDAFIAEFASSTADTMLLLLQEKTAGALLDEGGFAAVKAFLIKNENLFNLHNIKGEASSLGAFQKI